jgi:hypothetical protein
MKKDIAGEGAESTTPVFEVLESLVREQAQAFIQQILEEEVTELLGRGKSERREVVDGPAPRPGVSWPRPGWGPGKWLRLSGPRACAAVGEPSPSRCEPDVPCTAAGEPRAGTAGRPLPAPHGHRRSPTGHR